MEKGFGHGSAALDTLANKFSEGAMYGEKGWEPPAKRAEGLKNEDGWRRCLACHYCRAANSAGLNVETGHDDGVQ